MSGIDPAAGDDWQAAWIGFEPPADQAADSLLGLDGETVRSIRPHPDDPLILYVGSYDGVHYPFSVYDAGAQILANALDWLLPDKDTSDPFVAPRPGAMAHPPLGLMMLAFVLVALFLFDGFMGVSYLAAFCVPNAMPTNLYLEAFASLHQRMGLPAIEETEMSCIRESVQTFKNLK